MSGTVHTASRLRPRVGQLFCVLLLGTLALAACSAPTRSAASDPESSALPSQSQASPSPSDDSPSPTEASPSPTEVDPSQSTDPSAPALAGSVLPPPPTIDNVTTGDGSIAVTASGPSGAGVISQYKVSAVPEAGGSEITTQWPCRPWEMPCTISGLTPGVSYLVRVAAYNARGFGTPAEIGPVVASAPKPTPGPPPPGYETVLDEGGICKLRNGGAFIRAVHLTITNWLDEEVYLRKMKETRPFEEKGRIPPSGKAAVCADPVLGQNQAYEQNDIGFGQAPIERPTSGYQRIDLWNPWIGLPDVSIYVNDPNKGANGVTLKGNEGEGAAFAWDDKYFYVTRQQDDTCGRTTGDIGAGRICWNLMISRLPSGTQNGMKWSWGGGGETRGPDPVRRDG